MAFPMMPAVLFLAEVTVGPLLALGLQSFTRDSSALPPGPRGTPTSFSSSSSTDGDVDFQSPEASQGRRPGKGALANPRPGVDPGKGREAPQPTVMAILPESGRQPQCEKHSWVPRQEGRGLAFRGVCFSYLAQKGQGGIEDLLKMKRVSLSIFLISATKKYLWYQTDL